MAITLKLDQKILHAGIERAAESLRAFAEAVLKAAVPSEPVESALPRWIVDYNRMTIERMEPEMNECTETIRNSLGETKAIPRELMYLIRTDAVVACNVDLWRSGARSWEQMLTGLCIDLAERNELNVLRLSRQAMIAPGIPIYRGSAGRPAVRDAAKTDPEQIRSITGMSADQIRRAVDRGFDKIAIQLRDGSEMRYDVLLKISAMSSSRWAIALEPAGEGANLSRSQIESWVEAGLRRCNPGQIPGILYSFEFGIGPAIHARCDRLEAADVIQLGDGRTAMVPQAPAKRVRGLAVKLRDDFLTRDYATEGIEHSRAAGEAASRQRAEIQRELLQQIFDRFDVPTAQAAASASAMESVCNAAFVAPADQGCDECHGTKVYNCPIKGPQPCSLCAAAPADAKSA